MPIQRGSRYEYADIVFIPQGYYDDLQPALYYSFDVLGTLTYREYVWKSEDRIDRVAHQLYGSPTLWWVILEHNPEVEDPSNIPFGTVLRIPYVS